MSVDAVVKVGGGLLAHPNHFRTVLALLEDSAALRRLLIVPGGGPFADAVRHADRHIGLSDDAAHWMAVLAMDQYAHLLVSCMTAARLVTDTSGIGPALDAGRLPVLAPGAWLKTADPLPHTWDVTSDSIAAWVAGAVGARCLVLVKPPGAGTTAVDAYFSRVVPEFGGAPHVVPADQIAALRRAITV
jgi:aspartokinase-like uncharacterized kinase